MKILSHILMIFVYLIVGIQFYKMLMISCILFFLKKVLPELEYNLIAPIPHSHYITTDLIADLQDEMNSYAETATTVANLFTCSYVIKTNSMQIVCNNPAYVFRIITHPELKTIVWSGPSFDRDNPSDINDIVNLVIDIIV